MLLFPSQRANRKQADQVVIQANLSDVQANRSDIQFNRSDIQANWSADFHCISLDNHVYGQCPIME